MGFYDLFKKKTNDQSTDPFAQYRDMALFNSNCGIPLNCHVKVVPVLQSIVFPAVTLTDIWEKQAFNKLAGDLAKSLGGKHFNVCPVTEIMDLFQIEYRPNSGWVQEIEHLRLIHCVDYKEMYKDILCQIPTHINKLFSLPSQHPNANMLPEQLKSIQGNKQC